MTETESHRDQLVRLLRRVLAVSDETAFPFMADGPLVAARWSVVRSAGVWAVTLHPQHATAELCHSYSFATNDTGTLRLIHLGVRRATPVGWIGDMAEGACVGVGLIQRRTTPAGFGEYSNTRVISQCAPLSQWRVEVPQDEVRAMLPSMPDGLVWSTTQDVFMVMGPPGLTFEPLLSDGWRKAMLAEPFRDLSALAQLARRRRRMMPGAHAWFADYLAAMEPFVLSFGAARQRKALANLRALHLETT